MAYDKMSNGGKKGLLQNGKGMCSYKDNPMSAATRVKAECGPGMNPDQKKANKLLQKAQSSSDSLRGMSGM